jgi:hypothetical protein
MCQSVGRAGRTPTDEIDRTKKAFEGASSSDILCLMMSRGFLPWVDGLGDGNLADEIHKIKEAFPEDSSSDILGLMTAPCFLP